MRTPRLEPAQDLPLGKPIREVRRFLNVHSDTRTSKRTTVHAAVMRRVIGANVEWWGSGELKDVRFNGIDVTHARVFGFGDPATAAGCTLVLRTSDGHLQERDLVGALTQRFGVGKQIEGWTYSWTIGDVRILTPKGHEVLLLHQDLYEEMLSLAEESDAHVYTEGAAFAGSLCKDLRRLFDEKPHFASTGFNMSAKQYVDHSPFFKPVMIEATSSGHKYHFVYQKKDYGLTTLRLLSVDFASNPRQKTHDLYGWSDNLLIPSSYARWDGLVKY